MKRRAHKGRQVHRSSHRGTHSYLRTRVKWGNAARERGVPSVLHNETQSQSYACGDETFAREKSKAQSRHERCEYRDRVPQVIYRFTCLARRLPGHQPVSSATLAVWMERSTDTKKNKRQRVITENRIPEKQDIPCRRVHSKWQLRAMLNAIRRPVVTARWFALSLTVDNGSLYSLLLLSFVLHSLFYSMGK